MGGDFSSIIPRSGFLKSGQIVTGQTGLIYKGNDGNGRIIKPDDYQPKGSYAAVDHNHNGVYQPVGSYATTAQLNEVKTSVSNGKSAVASAITDKGVSTSATASFNTMANNIRSIQIGSVPIYIGEQTVRLSESSSHVEIPNLDPNLSYIFKFIRVQDSAVSIIYVPNINNIEYNLSSTDNKNQYHKYLSSFNKISSSYKYDEYAYVWVYVYIKSSTEKTIKYRIDTESRYKTQYIVSWYSLDPLL